MRVLNYNCRDRVVRPDRRGSRGQARFGSVAMLLVAMCVSGGAQAAAGWSEYASVDELNPMSRHYYTVRISGARSTSDCKDKEWFYQDYDSIASDKMFLTLLEALLSGKRVKVYVTGRCNLEGYSEISSVSVTR